MVETDGISDKEWLSNLIGSCLSQVDLGNDDHDRLLKETADLILRRNISKNKLVEIESNLLQNDGALVFILLAIKLARSKQIVREIKTPHSISVVFAVYQEHNRIKRPSEHPHGEDFLRKKIAQLKWLFDNNFNVHWDVIIVDDGCPDNSGQVAKEIIEKEGLNDRARVLFLKDAIEKKLPPVKELATVSESQKGGSILYGMWYAAQVHRSEDSIVLFTDADLSTNLGQVGLLLDPIINHNKSVAIGSRREANSVVVKRGGRNNRGKLFIYLWKRLITNLGEVVDTQCGFKAFRKELIIEIVEGMLEKKFTFDIELLIRAEKFRTGCIENVPIAWIDSEEASTTADLQPYLPMLLSITKMYRHYFDANPGSESFATLIEAMEPEDFNKLLDNIPEGILKREPREFSDYEGVSAEQLKRLFSNS